MKIAAPIAINFIEALSINYQNKSLNRHVLYQVKNVKSSFFPFFFYFFPLPFPFLNIIHIPIFTYPTSGLK